MNHLIIVKLKRNVTNMDEIIQQIEKLFEKSLELDGIHNIKIHKNIMKFPNRYDFMIDIEMEEESLKLFDNSKIHHIWKEKYSHYLEDKIIFDY